MTVRELVGTDWYVIKRLSHAADLFNRFIVLPSWNFCSTIISEFKYTYFKTFKQIEKSLRKENIIKLVNIVDKTVFSFKAMSLSKLEGRIADYTQTKTKGDNPVWEIVIEELQTGMYEAVSCYGSDRPAFLPSDSEVVYIIFQLEWTCNSHLNSWSFD